MSVIAVETIWRRIGRDGMPPLAKLVVEVHEDNECNLVGRIIDTTDYKDADSRTEPEERKEYTVEFFKEGFWFEAGVFNTFDAAVNRFAQSSQL